MCVYTAVSLMAAFGHFIGFVPQRWKKKLKEIKAMQQQSQKLCLFGKWISFISDVLAKVKNSSFGINTGASEAFVSDLDSGEFPIVLIITSAFSV